MKFVLFETREATGDLLTQAHYVNPADVTHISLVDGTISVFLRGEAAPLTRWCGDMIALEQRKSASKPGDAAATYLAALLQDLQA